MKDKNISRNLKEEIFLSRTYRRLKMDYISGNLYFFLFVIPCVLLLLFSYTQISQWICSFVLMILSKTTLLSGLTIEYSDFLPYFGGVYFLHLPEKLPTMEFLLVNVIISLVLCVVFLTGRRKGHPISIYFLMTLFIHLISIQFFIFAPDYFPYTNTNFSELYMKQQVGIWLSFMVLIGIITGLLGVGFIFRRIVTFLSIIGYSFLYGIIRYIVFSYILTSFSALYMAILFFSLGAFFDFLYLVLIYGFYVEKTIIATESQEGRYWRWS